MEKSEEAILKSLELNPSHARGLNTLGTIQARQDKLDDARTSFNKSISSQPDNVDAKINLANLEMKQGLAYSSLGDKVPNSSTESQSAWIRCMANLTAI